MYKVYDSYGKLVRGNFPTYREALQYKEVYGNPSWFIRLW